MRFSDLKNIIDHAKVTISSDKQITNLLIDSRSLISSHTDSSNVLFLAIKGSNHDGHHYLNEVYQQGIKQFIVEDLTVNLPTDCNVIYVESAVKACQKIAAAHRSNFEIPVVGITGSNGKTIIKEWLTAMVDQDFRVAKSPKSFNSQIGVPLSVWQINEQHTLGVFEAGISQPNEMQNLKQIIQPTIGIFTNIGEAHNGGFKSKESKIKEKLKLFESVSILIYCMDHQEIDHYIKENSSIQKIGWTYHKNRIKEGDVLISFDQNFLTFEFPDQVTFSIKPKYTDQSSLENLTHCIVCAVHLGIAINSLQKQVDQLEGIQMRLSMKQAKNNCYLIDDTYNSDLSALEVALDFLLQQNQRPKKTVILSDILQAGIENEQLYITVNKMLTARKISRLIGIGKQITQYAKVFSMSSSFYNKTSDFLETTPSFSNEMILVKGARVFQLEKIVSSLETKSHDTVLEVNLEAITHNLNHYRSKIKPTTKMMVMVKALAYGGSYEIANLLQYHGVDYLGVAYIDEGVRLRKNGITIPIMVMNIKESDFGLLDTFDLHPEIYNLTLLKKYIQYFTDSQAPPLHLKIETGMNRLGFVKKDVNALKELLVANKTSLRVKGIFTHLASADNLAHEQFTLQQLSLYEWYYRELTAVLPNEPIRHVLNTSGISNYPAYQYDMVRLGIGLYGYDSANSNGLRTVSTFKTYISQVKSIKKGETVGYGLAFTAAKDMQVATLAVGYADGYRRSLSNGKGKVNINGKLVPTVGNICMDMSMVDVTGLSVNQGDEVILFGKSPSIENLAEWMGTIPYEILTNVGDRINRIFISE